MLSNNNKKKTMLKKKSSIISRWRGEKLKHFVSFLSCFSPSFLAQLSHWVAKFFIRVRWWKYFHMSFELETFLYNLMPVDTGTGKWCTFKYFRLNFSMIRLFWNSESISWLESGDLEDVCMMRAPQKLLLPTPPFYLLLVLFNIGMWSFYWI